MLSQVKLGFLRVFKGDLPKLPASDNMFSKTELLYIASAACFMQLMGCYSEPVDILQHRVGFCMCHAIISSIIFLLREHLSQFRFVIIQCFIVVRQHLSLIRWTQCLRLLWHSVATFCALHDKQLSHLSHLHVSIRSTIVCLGYDASMAMPLD